MPFVGTPWRVGSRVTEFYSSIMASLPSDTGSTSRKRSCSELDDENHDNDRVDRHYDRWFVVQSVDSGHPSSKLSPFLLSKAIKSAVGTVKTLRRLRNGDVLLEVSDIMNISVIDDSGGRRNTNTFTVTFKAPTTPKYLHVGYLRVPVSI